MLDLNGCALATSDEADKLISRTGFTRAFEASSNSTRGMRKVAGGLFGFMSGVNEDFLVADALVETLGELEGVLC